MTSSCEGSFAVVEPKSRRHPFHPMKKALEKAYQRELILDGAFFEKIHGRIVNEHTCIATSKRKTKREDSTAQTRVRSENLRAVSEITSPTRRHRESGDGGSGFAAKVFVGAGREKVRPITLEKIVNLAPMDAHETLKLTVARLQAQGRIGDCASRSCSDGRHLSWFVAKSSFCGTRPPLSLMANSLCQRCGG